MTPIAKWLQDARRSQAMPGNGRPWTQDYFLERMKAETGWAPSYAPYNRLEQGKSQPRPETLQRLVAYWTSKGIAAPDFTPEAAKEPAPDLAQALVLLADELRATRLEREELRREREAQTERMEALERAVRALVASRDGASPARHAPLGSAE